MYAYKFEFCAPTIICLTIVPLLPQKNQNYAVKAIFKKSYEYMVPKWYNRLDHLAKPPSPISFQNWNKFLGQLFHYPQYMNVHYIIIQYISAFIHLRPKYRGIMLLPGDIKTEASSSVSNFQSIFIWLCEHNLNICVVWPKFTTYFSSYAQLWCHTKVSLRGYHV